MAVASAAPGSIFWKQLPFSLLVSNKQRIRESKHAAFLQVGLEREEAGSAKQRRETGRTGAELSKIQGSPERLVTQDGRCLVCFSSFHHQAVNFSRESPVQSCWGVFLRSSGMNSLLRHLAQKVLRFAFATSH